MLQRLELRRFPAWVVVLGYLVVTLIVDLLPEDIDPARIVINGLLFLLFIGFLVARGGYEGWAIFGSWLLAGALEVFVGHRLLDLPVRLSEALSLPVAPGLTYLLVDRRLETARPVTAGRPGAS